jgi:hypothetical protein
VDRASVLEPSHTTAGKALGEASMSIALARVRERRKGCLKVPEKVGTRKGNRRFTRKPDETKPFCRALRAALLSGNGGRICRPLRWRTLVARDGVQSRFLLGGVMNRKLIRRLAFAASLLMAKACLSQSPAGSPAGATACATTVPITPARISSVPAAGIRV